MKVAFCSVSAIDDRSYWSGTPYFMAKHLQLLSGWDVIDVRPLPVMQQPYAEKSTLYTKVFKEGYLCEFEPLLQKCLSNEVDRRLRSCGGAELVFSPGCFPYPNTFLETETPVVFWADATFANLLNFFPSYSNLCAETVWCGEEIQQRMLFRTRRAIFASQWAADSACDRYGFDRARVSVIPYGANLHFAIESEAQLDDIVSKRDSETCRLLLVARQWHEKSGDFALSVLDAVQTSGVACTLAVAGCQPPDEIRKIWSDSLEVLPLISKDGAQTEQAYVDLLASTHFLLHPSVTTCFGIGICEANAWGVPALAHTAGGVGSVVIDGENGFLFPAQADPADYAKKIVELFSESKSYEKLCRSSWEQFRSRLNWKTSAQKVRAVCEEIS